MNDSPKSTPAVSVVIPVYNGAETIRHALKAVHESTFRDFEIVVVNDGSTDNTMDVLSECAGPYPYKLVALDHNTGVSHARNAGAAAASGRILLFIDADCVVMPPTIQRCVERLTQSDCICVGGAYTSAASFDKDFFSQFQSLYIHYVETKNQFPDYIATHCMAMRKDDFEGYGGFIEDSFIGHQASVEDVEFSHRMLRAGHCLTRPADIQVMHIFRFTFAKSIRNAIKKSKYWTMYSLHNRDVMKDSGAASYELKIDVVTQTLNLALVIAAVATRFWWLLLPVPILFALNIGTSYGLLRLFKRERGWGFFLVATGYYQFVYPAGVAYGSLIGTLKYIWEVKILRRYR